MLKEILGWARKAIATFHAIPYNREMVGLAVGGALIAFAPQIAALIAPWGMKVALTSVVKLIGAGVGAANIISAFAVGPIFERFHRFMRFPA